MEIGFEDGNVRGPDAEAYAIDRKEDSGGPSCFLRRVHSLTLFSRFRMKGWAQGALVDRLSGAPEE